MAYFPEWLINCVWHLMLSLPLLLSSFAPPLFFLPKFIAVCFKPIFCACFLCGCIWVAWFLRQVLYKNQTCPLLLQLFLVILRAAVYCLYYSACLVVILCSYALPQKVSFPFRSEAINEGETDPCSQFLMECDLRTAEAVAPALARIHRPRVLQVVRDRRSRGK